MNIDLAFKLYYRPLCLYATHYIGDIDIAEDIVQDCFVHLIETQCKSGMTVLEPRPYLYAAVRNRCLNNLRRGSVVQANPLPADIEGVITDDEAAEASLHEAELWTAIDSLPTKCREVFLMSKQRGMRYHDIAMALGTFIRADSLPDTVGVCRQ